MHAVVFFLLSCLAAPALSALGLLEADRDAVQGRKGEAIQRFANLLRFQTVSSLDAPEHVLYPDEFEATHAYIASNWPSLLGAAHVRVQRVAKWSLVVEWPGTDPELQPLLFVSHLDVVPAEAERWSRPPFSGEVADGYVWGRGSRDVKVGVAALLEAASILMQGGFEPERSVVLAFGHDEEVGGQLGARAIAAHFAARGGGMVFDMVVDEGANVQADGFQPLTRTPVAMVGVAEKGYASMEVEVHSSGGHSSVPPLDGSAASSRLAALVGAVDGAPPPARLSSPTLEFLEALAPAAPWPWSALLSSAANRAIGPLLAWVMTSPRLRGPDAAAMVRTTAACTRLATGGLADNVLPTNGTACFNFRLLPGDDPHDVPKQYLESRAAAAGLSLGLPRGRAGGGGASGAAAAQEGEGVAGGARVVVRPVEDAPVNPATPVAPLHGRHFAAVQGALMDVYGGGKKGLVVAPVLNRGGTDSLHYLQHNLTNGGRIYRITPITNSEARGEAAGVHGVDERCAEDDYLSAVTFYIRLMRAASAVATRSSGGGASVVA